MSPALQPWQLAMTALDAEMQPIIGRDPYLFVTQVLGIPAYGTEGIDPLLCLDKWQDTFLREFMQSSRHSVRSGHGTGKGALIAWLALWFVLTHYDSKCVLTANSQDQLRDNNWPEIKKWHRRLPVELQGQLQVDEERMFVKGAPEMAFVVRRTASKHNPEALQGIHAEHVMYLLDEASGIPDIVFEVAQGSLSTAGAIAVMMSNPTRSTGFFHRTHNSDLRQRWRCWRVNAEDVPRAHSSVAEYAETYGRNSNKYRVRVLGEFPTQEDQTVIPLHLVEAALTRQVPRANVWPIMGVDVARFGDDKSAILVRQGNVLISKWTREWGGLDGSQVAGRIIAMYNSMPPIERPKEIWVDEIGVGTSVLDQLRVPGSPVREITRGGNVSDKTVISETEYRFRDELWFRGRAWFEERTAMIEPTPDHPEITKLMQKLVGELSSPTYDYTILGKRIVQSKKEMRKEGIPSPNLADAFLLTLAGGIHPRVNPYMRSETPSSGSGWAA